MKLKQIVVNHYNKDFVLIFQYDRTLKRFTVYDDVCLYNKIRLVKNICTDVLLYRNDYYTKRNQISKVLV